MIKPNGCRLIEQKGDVNERDKDGSTPLMHATWHDCVDFVKALCENVRVVIVD